MTIPMFTEQEQQLWSLLPEEELTQSPRTKALQNLLGLMQRTRIQESFRGQREAAKKKKTEAETKTAGQVLEELPHIRASLHDTLAESRRFAFGDFRVVGDVAIVVIVCADIEHAT